MTNPVEEFLEEVQEKTAFGMSNLRSFGEAMQSGMQSGLGMAAGAAVLTGGAVAASKIYDAATKKRDFNKMMEFNPHLQSFHAKDPKMFNQMYTSLRQMNPAFAKDPLVAGRYMGRMVDDPLGAGGILAESSGSVPKSYGQFSSAVLESGRKGFEKGMEFPKATTAPSELEQLTGQVSMLRAKRDLEELQNPRSPSFGGRRGRW